MEYLAGILAELLLIFEDFKFWLKRRKQRNYERKHGVTRTIVLYPSQKTYIIVLLIALPLFVISGAFFLSGNVEKQNAKKLSEVASLLKHEKETSGHYPEQLETIVRNNPLLKNVHTDYWGREFFYERHSSGESYILCSLGKDGKLNTADDIKIEFKTD